MKIKCIILKVSDPQQQAELFINTLEFVHIGELALNDDLKGIMIQSSHKDITFCLLQADHTQFNLYTLLINVEDCLKTSHYLKNHQLEQVCSPAYTTSGLMATFKDFEGNDFIFLEERDYQSLQKNE